MKRVAFDNPNTKKEKSYMRIRDEWNKITCTYKEMIGGELSINSVKELECEVSDFGVLKQIFNNMWIKEKAYQETYREIWTVDNEILFMIDERPGLEPFIEIEWKSEDIVKMYSEKLGFDYNDWIFWTVDEIYYKELWLSHDYINSLPIITFENPPR